MNTVSPNVAPADRLQADLEVDVVVIGAGACGLTAALRAAEVGGDVLVFEKSSRPSGSTSLSSGFVPAAATSFQRRQGIDDSADLFATDIQIKAGGQAVPHLVDLATRSIAPALEWLGEAHGVEWVVLDDFLYPGHSRHRMHAVPEKTGEALQTRLLDAAERAGISVVCDATAQTLFVDGRRVAGVAVRRPDGRMERVACRSLVLACNGFGGNGDLVRRYLPIMADAPFFGHDGNTGEAVLWGEQLGAQLAGLSACQGHGSVADPGGLLITWALMMEGGFQVNADGRRFSNEHLGYSEQAVDVLGQPGAHAWCVFDGRLLEMAQDFADFRDAEAMGLVRSGATVDTLAAAMGVPGAALQGTFDDVSTYAADLSADPFGRDFSGRPVLAPPYHAVRVTGALFHTQGGLMIDDRARVTGSDAAPLDNLFAGGGAACGVSGNHISGYLSGNGLLTAIAFGFVAGRQAATVAAGQTKIRTRRE